MANKEANAKNFFTKLKLGKSDCCSISIEEVKQEESCCSVSPKEVSTTSKEA